jgi:UDP:flavonoid glycosyltransferase YjiC (YdhE family)
MYFWGRRVAALGVGPYPILRRELTAERLADAIRISTSDTGMKQRAAELGQRIRSEDGVANAVRAFHQHVSITPDKY